MPIGVSYTLAMACAVGIAALGYFVIKKPISDWRRDVSHRAELVRTRLEVGPELRSQHHERQEQLKALLTRVELVNRRVPDEASEGEFLADLSKIADDNQVTIDDFRRGGTTDTKTHSLVEVTVNARGSHRGICGLVDAVERLPRLAELTQLEIDSSDTGDNYPIRLTYALYYGMATPTPASTAAQ